MRRTRWAAGVAVLTVLLPSCSSAEPETSETAAPAPTTPAEIDAAELMAAVSSAQQEAGTYQMEMTFASEGVEFDATGAARYPDSGQVPDLSMIMNLPPEQGGEIEMVVIDESAYLRLPPDAGLPTPWLKIQSDGSDPISAQMAPLIDQMTSNADFEQYAEKFGSAASIDQLGTDVIDGVDVTEYVVTVDVSKMPADELGGVAPEDLPVDEVTYSLWIDGDDLVRRVTSDLAGYGTTDLTIFAYGESVEIEAPPADQVTDASALQ
jgi:HSP20 family molecular chaperone IbpA